MHLDHAKRDLQDLEGEGNFSLVSGGENDLLPDPGGAPQQQERSLGQPKGAQDNGGGGTGHWVNPREQVIAAWTTRKKKTDDVAMIRAITLSDGQVMINKSRADYHFRWRGGNLTTQREFKMAIEFLQV